MNGPSFQTLILYHVSLHQSILACCYLRETRIHESDSRLQHFKPFFDGANVVCLFVCLVVWLFVCLFVLNDRPKELANNFFGHGDLQALPCPGLQQADTKPLSSNYFIRHSENAILKPYMYVLTNPFGLYSICSIFF